jgi:hypothetical protein
MPGQTTIRGALARLWPRRETFQARVRHWLVACFGENFADDEQERDARLLEEVLELIQSKGWSIDELWQLARYVWSRPKGEPEQELGGVMTTLAAFALSNGLDMHAAGEKELARIWTKVDAIREKQRTKPAQSRLPGHYPGQGGENDWEPTDAEVHSACLSYRHDFGLLPDRDRRAVEYAARSWLKAWLREMPKTAALRMPPASAQTAVEKTSELA